MPLSSGYVTSVTVRVRVTAATSTATGTGTGTAAVAIGIANGADDVGVSDILVCFPSCDTRSQ